MLALKESRMYSSKDTRVKRQGTEWDSKDSDMEYKSSINFTVSRKYRNQKKLFREVGKILEQVLHSRRYSKSKYIMEDPFTFIKSRGNANETYNEISLHAHPNS